MNTENRSRISFHTPAGAVYQTQSNGEDARRLSWFPAGAPHQIQRLSDAAPCRNKSRLAEPAFLSFPLNTSPARITAPCRGYPVYFSRACIRRETAANDHHQDDEIRRRLLFPKGQETRIVKASRTQHGHPAGARRARNGPCRA